MRVNRAWMYKRQFILSSKNPPELTLGFYSGTEWIHSFYSVFICSLKIYLAVIITHTLHKISQQEFWNETNN